jgi:hypothetical protein
MSNNHQPTLTCHYRLGKSSVGKLCFLYADHGGAVQECDTRMLKKAKMLVTKRNTSPILNL